MIVYIHNKFVPAGEAMVSVFDRGFLYGDGVFETMRIYQGQPFRWTAHYERLERSAHTLGITHSLSSQQLREIADELVRRNALPDALLRLTLTRGAGARGYAPKDCGPPTLVMALFAPPSLAEPRPWRLITARTVQAAGGLLAGMKSCNRLPQVLARMEADAAEADEAVLLNSDGKVAEGAASNVFIVQRGAVVTPELETGALPGVTRAVVKELCGEAGIEFRETVLGLDDLHQAEGVFVSLSSMGIVEATCLDQRKLNRAPLVEELQRHYAELVTAETRASAGKKKPTSAATKEPKSGA